MPSALGPPQRPFHPGEFALVIALAFGISLVASLSAAIDYAGRPIEIDDRALVATLAYELVFGSVIAAILRLRGWTWRDFAVHASPGSTAIGLAAGVVILALWYVIEATIGKVPLALSATWLWIVAISIVNPLFEELLVLGYVVQSLRGRFGLAIAANASIALRVAYHLYEGPMAVAPIVLFAVVATLSYLVLGRLWPAIVMHALLDFAAFAFES